MEIEEIYKLCDRKTELIKELNSILIELDVEKVDLLADKSLRIAVNNHIALELK